MKILLVSSCSNIAHAYASLLRDYECIEEVDTASTMVEVVSFLHTNHIDLFVASEEAIGFLEDAAPFMQKTKIPKPKSVLVLPHVSGRAVVEAIRYGFNDVIDLAQSGSSIITRLRMVVRGEIDLATNSYVDGIRAMLDGNNRCRLANDEIDLQILSELAKGHSNKEIADTVFLSLQTVRNRISRLMQVTEAQNRTQLALMFIQD